MQLGPTMGEGYGIGGRSPEKKEENGKRQVRKANCSEYHLLR